MYVCYYVVRSRLPPLYGSKIVLVPLKNKLVLPPSRRAEMRELTHVVVQLDLALTLTGFCY